MKHPAQWSKEEFYTCLQHSVDLELWTLPLYLTALYSIKGLKDLNSRNYSSTAKLIASVATQEMLHLEIACNLCNAMGYSPVFSKPVYENGIPFLKPDAAHLPDDIKNFVVQTGSLNENTLKLFCAIELPEPKTHRAWNDDETFDSIGHLYESIYIAINLHWEKCFVGEANNKCQNSNFNFVHQQQGLGLSQTINSIEEAHAAIEAIIEQGEGANDAFVKPDYRPLSSTKENAFDLSSYESELSHYQKFRLLLHHKQHLPQVYDENNLQDAAAELQDLQHTFSQLLQLMEYNFNTEGNQLPSEFWNTMFDMKTKIIAVWEKGVCPRF